MVRPTRARVLIALLLSAAVPALPQAPDQSVIQGGTHVVLVNVVARDKHGKPVDDLTRDDFLLRDNGRDQKITLFAIERAKATSPASSVIFGGAANALTFTNRPAPDAPILAFLFDELNTQVTDQQTAKRDFLRYLRTLPSDSRVAVFVLGDSLSLLHDFSQDMASLLAALSRHTNRVNPEVSASTAPPASSHSITGDPSSTTRWDNFMQASSRPYVNYAETVRATRTAAALETIAGHLQGIAGRKTLIWISGGFPIQLGLHDTSGSLPQGNSNGRRPVAGKGSGGGGRSGGGGASNSTSVDSSAPTPSVAGNGLSFDPEVTRAIRALNEADVAVYPVDALGLTPLPAIQADRSSIGKRGKPPGAASPPDYNYETLEMLAGETGGRAFHDINDLNAAIQEAAADARVSYSLAFAPASASLDGSYHRIEVTAKRPDLKLRYRLGYVAAADKAAAPPLAEAIANPVALTGIGFAVHLAPVEGGYQASVTIDPAALTLEPKDGKWTGSLQFLVVVGTVEQLTTIPLSFTEDVFRRIQNKGLTLGARVKTPPGTRGFSMGFRDIPSGAVGTLHVPLF